MSLVWALVYVLGIGPGPGTPRGKGQPPLVRTPALLVLCSLCPSAGGLLGSVLLLCSNGGVLVHCEWLFLCICLSGGGPGYLPGRATRLY